MNKGNYNHKTTEVLIYVMGGIGVLFALGSILPFQPLAFLMLCAAPLVFSILFMITKNPIFGLLYTILFIANRSNLFTGGFLLIPMIITLGMILFFADVVYRSYVRWKEVK